MTAPENCTINSNQPLIAERRPDMPQGRVPWSGHSGQHAVPQLIEEIGRNRTTLIFWNYRDTCNNPKIVSQSLQR